MAEPGRLLRLVWADTAYQGPALAQAFAAHGIRVGVVRHPDGTRGFVVLARRWAVERTLEWLSRARCLNRDHERRPDHHTDGVVGRPDHPDAEAGERAAALAGVPPRRMDPRPG